MIQYVVRNLAGRTLAKRAEQARSNDTIAAIDAAANPVQLRFFQSNDRYSSLICPRRAGKTFAIIAKALRMLESKPNSRFMLVATNSQTARKNYWLNAPGGVPEQLKLYGIDAKRNDTMLSWKHPNGSVGFLVGVDGLDDVDKVRGAQAEVDLCVIDECQSIKPYLLDALLEKVVGPGLMTRQGSVILAGTPGTIAAGSWYQASCPSAKNLADKPTCKTVLNVEPGHEQAYWSRWHWTIQDNLKAPDQWADALATKQLKGWNDTNETWQREYLGLWVIDASELVYSFAKYRDRPGHVTCQDADMSKGVWHTVAGLDYGYEDATAVVVLAYSEAEDKVYNLYNYQASHMTVDDIGEMLVDLNKRYKLQAIAADTSGKTLSETFRNRFGLPMHPAMKTAKQDYIEQVNSDFQAGRIKIIRGSELDDQLCSLQYDLQHGTKAQLASEGRLKEDKRLPNHLCDAFLYGMRHCLHHFSVGTPVASPGIDPDLKAAIDDARRQRQGNQNYAQAYRELAEATESLRQFSVTTDFDYSGYPGLIN